MPSLWVNRKPSAGFFPLEGSSTRRSFVSEKNRLPEIINIGCGEDITIRELAELICDVVGFNGELVWDAAKPDGTPRKLLDTTKLRALGWQPTIPLRQGVAQTYDWFLKNVAG